MTLKTRRREHVTVLAIIAALSSGSVLAGCPGNLDDKDKYTSGSGGGGQSGPTTTSTGDPATTTTGAGAPSCPDVPAFLAAKCAEGAGCHDSSMTFGFHMEVGFEATIGDTQAKTCGGPLLVPGNPDGSTIFTKLLPTNTCGTRMPFGAPMPLSDEEINCVREWIIGLASGT